MKKPSFVESLSHKIAISEHYSFLILAVLPNSSLLEKVLMKIVMMLSALYIKTFLVQSKEKHEERKITESVVFVESVYNVQNTQFSLVITCITSLQ